MPRAQESETPAARAPHGDHARVPDVALGVRCDFCHVQGDFASDEKPHKEIARKMIVMAREINANFPDGKMHVTCYTCHRGSEEPATKPGETPHADHAEHGRAPVAARTFRPDS
jgi:hypothetical protein